jgi:hypothetical protein
MSVTIKLDLPEEVVREAQANGLLETHSMAQLIATELRRRKAASELGKVLDELREQPGEAMTPDDIQAQVNAVRTRRRAARETGR